MFALIFRNWKFLTTLVLIFMCVAYLQSQIEEAKRIVTLENKVEQQENYIDTRKGIDDATKGVSNITDDSALKWLRDRRERNGE